MGRRVLVLAHLPRAQMGEFAVADVLQDERLGAVGEKTEGVKDLYGRAHGSR